MQKKNSFPRIKIFLQPSYSLYPFQNRFFVIMIYIESNTQAQCSCESCIASHRSIIEKTNILLFLIEIHFWIKSIWNSSWNNLEKAILCDRRSPWTYDVLNRHLFKCLFKRMSKSDGFSTQYLHKRKTINDSKLMIECQKDSAKATKKTRTFSKMPGYVLNTRDETPRSKVYVHI